MHTLLLPESLYSPEGIDAAAHEAGACGSHLRALNWGPSSCISSPAFANLLTRLPRLHKLRLQFNSYYQGPDEAYSWQPLVQALVSMPLQVLHLCLDTDYPSLGSPLPDLSAAMQTTRVQWTTVRLDGPSFEGIRRWQPCGWLMDRTGTPPSHRLLDLEPVDGSDSGEDTAPLMHSTGDTETCAYRQSVDQWLTCCIGNESLEAIQLWTNTGTELGRSVGDFRVELTGPGLMPNIPAALAIRTAPLQLSLNCVDLATFKLLLDTFSGADLAETFPIQCIREVHLNLLIQQDSSETHTDLLDQDGMCPGQSIVAIAQTVPQWPRLETLHIDTEVNLPQHSMLWPDRSHYDQLSEALDRSGLTCLLLSGVLFMPPPPPLQVSTARAVQRRIEQDLRIAASNQGYRHLSAETGLTDDLTSQIAHHTRQRQPDRRADRALPWFSPAQVRAVIEAYRQASRQHNRDPKTRCIQVSEIHPLMRLLDAPGRTRSRQRPT